MDIDGEDVVQHAWEVVETVMESGDRAISLGSASNGETDNDEDDVSVSMDNIEEILSQSRISGAIQRQPSTNIFDDCAASSRPPKPRQINKQDIEMENLEKNMRRAEVMEAELRRGGFERQLPNFDMPGNYFISTL
jgi:hypothetical protein